MESPLRVLVLVKPSTCATLDGRGRPSGVVGGAADVFVVAQRMLSTHSLTSSRFLG